MQNHPLHLLSVVTLLVIFQFAFILMVFERAGVCPPSLQALIPDFQNNRMFFGGKWGALLGGGEGAAGIVHIVCRVGD